MSTEHPVKDFETPNKPTWCPGCGNFGIWTALKQALAELKKEPHETVVVFGIGCSGNEANFVRAYGFHGLHGRALPLAEGIALAHHGLTTVVVAGDGDGYGEGMAHFIHTIRANPNITYLVHNNQVYGLTKGQASPTSMRGFPTPSTPQGAVDAPVNPVALALAAGAGFVARGFAGDSPHLTQLIKEAITYRGLGFVDILQHCVTFNHTNTYMWFYRRIEKLESIKHDAANREAAWLQSQRGIEKIPIGIFFRKEQQTLEDGYSVLSSTPLVKQPAEKRDLGPLFATLE